MLVAVVVAEVSPEQLADKVLGRLALQVLLLVPLGLMIHVPGGESPACKPWGELGRVVPPHQAIPGLLVLIQRLRVPNVLLDSFEALIFPAGEFEARPSIFRPLCLILGKAEICESGQESS